MNSASAITNAIKSAAHEAGFDLCGIAPADGAQELEYFPEWIADGYAGEMKYLEARNEQGSLKRSSLAHVAPWARSVIVCAINYNSAQPYSTECTDKTRGWISRYAWGREDYHEAVLRRLRRLDDGLKVILHQAGGELREVVSRSYVDTGPLVERVYAKYAGIGWIGKNTCVINQQKGSWLFLGVILTSLELQPDIPAPDRCGTCTRCIDACPTDAFIGPYRLDSNKCISYLTIEKRGEIPEELRAGMGNHIFGCDICQDVCPWNRKAPTGTAEEFIPRQELINPALDWLAEMNAEEFRSVFRGSPVKRTKFPGFKRNAAIAMGNSADPKFLPMLDELVGGSDASVAQTARWAKTKIAETT